MKKIENRKFFIIILALIIFICCITITIGDFFFTTQYYKNPINAYNATATNDIITGASDEAVAVLDLISLDDNNCLFLGKIDENRFVVNEMRKKNKKYASYGTSYFYDLREDDDEIQKNETAISDGIINWGILFTNDIIDTLKFVDKVKPIKINNTTIYLVIYC